MRLKNEPLSRYTYMKVGGPADELIIATTTNELVDAIVAARSNEQRYMVIGGGSNTLFSDSGFRGLIIVNRANHISIDTKTGLVVADTGVIVNALVNQLNQSGLGGLAEFFGLPGTIGGAVYNNSHYGKKLIGDYVTRVEILDGADMRQWVDRNTLSFAYDYSNLQKTHDTVLRVEFKLEPGDPIELQKIAADTMEKRRTGQPLTVPSSGCMFQNPSDASAGALIDQAGFKGCRVGGAMVSDKHANFIVNAENATTQDIIDLSNKIITGIQKKFNRTLKREVFILNEVGERINS